MESMPEKSEASEMLNDAWNFKGGLAIRSQTGGWRSAAMILGVELFERLTTLGIAVNLVTYLTGTMHLGNAAAANTVTNFLGTSFILPLFGGFLADTFIGRYLTIAIFASIQASGVILLTISTAARGLRPPQCLDLVRGGCVPATGTQLGVLYLALYLTALGTGGIKSSVSGFGSDQFDESDQAEQKQMLRFFNWFFFFINIGALMAVTVVVYIQDHAGRKWGYGICALAIVFGMAVFLAGSPRYRFKKLAGSPLTQIAAVFTAALRNRNLKMPSDPYFLHDMDASGEEEGQDRRNTLKLRLPLSCQLRFLNRAAIMEAGPAGGSDRPSRWKLSTVTDVEEVKMVVGMVPIWATTIMFWTVYAQMTTFSVSQASAMDRRIGRSSFEIPAGSLTVFFVASILVTIPVYDRLLAPLARRITGDPQGLCPLRRIAVGLLLSVLAMAIAALTELRRLQHRHISVFWLVPQFFLVGSGEAFTYTGQLGFFLRECPKGMKAMSTGLFLSTLSLGFFLSSILVAIVHRISGRAGGWLPDDLNNGKLYDFYWLLSVLSGLNFLLFLMAARRYAYNH